MSAGAGHLMAPPSSQAGMLTDLLHRGRPGFVELVAATRSPEGRLDDFRRGRFVRAGRSEEFLAALEALGRGDRVELFFTPATLARRLSGNDAVRALAVAWVDIDDPARLVDLRRFPHRPHAVVASGSGGVHAYWLLAGPLPAPRAESLNRRLAAALGGDLASANRGRILRAPGSMNFKATSSGEGPRVCRLVVCEPARPRHDAAVLARGLPDPKEPRPRGRAVVIAPPDDAAPWRSLEAADYYRLLTGREPARDGTVRCPSSLHEDRHPSAHLYPGAGRGWFCFACGAGGGAVDMVAALRGWPTGAALRGRRFAACADELRRLLGAAVPR
ncbi:MAG TPA: DNA-primase RepB domain-containing protein [Solirubrobacterales bacterium]|nr:DNA-primase RepB domain-containing protein [Solirubrobacterales bacterium]